MQRQSKDLTTQADKLQAGLDRDREALARMRSELSAAGVDTGKLTEHQSKLEAQTKRVTDAQNRLKTAQANFEAARQNLSWNNIKGDIMTSAGLAYSLYKPVKQAADFESAMARVNAVAFTGLGKTDAQKALDAKEFQKLQEQARELGRSTQYTAVQVANTQEVLTRAGFKSNEVISAMPGLLSMAAAEGMDLSSAADIAASSLRGFKLPADQMNRVADVLAQTSAASNTSIAGLGESMKMVAPVAASLGVSIEQTSAMLGVMANNGIKGTESGTALRNAFLRLSQEPKAVEKALNRMGIASRDAEGNMRTMPSIMLALSKRMKGMGKADQLKNLADIFGVRAASGMLAVMQGAVDGSLDELERLNKEATGIFIALSDNIAKTTGGKITVNTEEMRAAMKDVEPLAQKVGVSFRDLSIYTAMLAKNGIKGADANKMMAQTFTKLANKPKEVDKALRKHKITLYADGKMKDFPDLLREIGNAISGLDDKAQRKTLSKIFGGDEAAIAAQKWIKGMNDGSWFELDEAAKGAKGISHQMMEAQLATLQGQLTKAKSAFSDLGIEIGNALLPNVTKIVEKVTNITAAIVDLMEEYKPQSEFIIKTLGTIAGFKIAKKISNIGFALGKLPFKWLEVQIATANAANAAGTITTAIGNSATGVSNLKSLIHALTGPIGLVSAAVVLLALHWEDVCKWCEKAGEAINGIDRSVPIGQLRSAPALQFNSNSAEYGVRVMESAYSVPEIKQHAMGGIITSPTLSWVGEAGREAIIPLTKQGRGTQLWVEAGRELGVINNTSTGDVISDIVNALKIQNWNEAQSFGAVSSRISESISGNGAINISSSELSKVNSITPHATGGIFSQSHIGLIAEAGREAIIPLTKQDRGTQLWFEAGRELGVISNTSVGDVITDIVNALKIQSWSEAQGFGGVSSRIFESISGNGAINVSSLELQKINNITPHATGGIFSQPHIGLVAEAGREAIIPLTKQDRGTQLWVEAGRELGVINNTSAGDVITDIVNALKIQNWSEAQSFGAVSSRISESISGNGAINVSSLELQKINNITPHATGGIFSQPHIGLVAEAGREAIIPLTKQDRGTQLWVEAGRELGLLSSGADSQNQNGINMLTQIMAQAIPQIPQAASSLFNQHEANGISLREAAENENYYSFRGATATHNNNSPQIVFSPNITVTVNGSGNAEPERQYRQITEEIFEDMFIKFQEKLQRVGFD